MAGTADFPRTRLTHTLEVAQIAREMGSALGCDPDLVDVAGLAHDLGHPPFGHNGEGELNRLSESIGGFEGNAQTLRVMTRLEAKVIDPATGRSVGLDLTRASLDAACKYPWPRRDPSGVDDRRGSELGGKAHKFGYYADDAEIFHWLREGAPGERTCLEEQVMDWADDVAYSVHDLEDALHAGLITLDMFTSATERENIMDVAHRGYLPLVDPTSLGAALDRLLALDYWPSSYDGSQRDLAALKTATSRLIGRFCVAAEHATRAAYSGERLTRYAASLVVPDEVRAEVAALKAMTAIYVMNRAGADVECLISAVMICAKRWSCAVAVTSSRGSPRSSMLQLMTADASGWSSIRSRASRMPVLWRGTPDSAASPGPGDSGRGSRPGRPRIGPWRGVSETRMSPSCARRRGSTRSSATTSP